MSTGYTPIEKITIKFGTGVYIEDAIKFAEEISEIHKCEVEFAFNDYVFSGGYKLVPSYVIEKVPFTKELKDD